MIVKEGGTRERRPGEEEEVPPEDSLLIRPLLSLLIAGHQLQGNIAACRNDFSFTQLAPLLFFLSSSLSYTLRREAVTDIGEVRSGSIWLWIFIFVLLLNFFKTIKKICSVLFDQCKHTNRWPPPSGLFSLLRPVLGPRTSFFKKHETSTSRYLWGKQLGTVESKKRSSRCQQTVGGWRLGEWIKVRVRF